MAEHNDYLYIRTAHIMYRTSDGLNHQANMTIKVREKDMKIVDSAYKIEYTPYGYVSHSFNQFLMFDDEGNFIALDHGDAYPRAARIFKTPGKLIDSADMQTINEKGIQDIYDEITLAPDFTDYDAYKFSYIDTFQYKCGHWGENFTGATIGGLEYSSTSYLTAGTSIPQYESSEIGDHFGRNVYVSITDRKDFSETGTKIKWITNYPDINGGACAMNPYLVKLEKDKFLLIWSEGSESYEDHGNGNGAGYGKKTEHSYYELIDGHGNSLTDIFQVDEYLSDCQPIVKNGTAIWYTMDDTQIYFYQIDSSGKFTKKEGSFDDTVEKFPKDLSKNCYAVLSKIGDITIEEFEKCREENNYPIVVFYGEKRLESGKDYYLSVGFDTYATKLDWLYIYISGRGNYTNIKEGEISPIKKQTVLQSAVSDLSGIFLQWQQEKGALGYIIERTDESGIVLNYN